MIDQYDHQQQTANGPHFDKFGNRPRHKSIIRDASFWPDFLGVWSRSVASASAGTSVIYPPTSTHTSHTSSPSAPTSSPSKTSARAISPKLDRFMRSQPRSSPVDFRVPASWSDLSLPFSALYYHWASESMGQTNAFTLRLDADVEAQARGADEGAAAFLRRRITYRLKQSLGRTAEFWFVLENAKTGARGLHLHGELVASSGELPAVRKALRAAGGEWIEARQHQAHTHENPDAGWIGYVTADDVLMRKHRNGRLAAMLSAQRGFNGANRYASQQLRSLARKLYDRDRTAVIKELARA